MRWQRGGGDKNGDGRRPGGKKGRWGCVGTSARWLIRRWRWNRRSTEGLDENEMVVSADLVVSWL